jgi:molybdate transport system substrate-binding protein
MLNFNRRQLGALFGAFGLILVLAPQRGFAQTSANPAPLVFAAASMKTALDAVAAAWKANTGKTTAISYASSAVLAKQIEQGAPADIFISADQPWMDYLEKAKDILPGTRKNLVENQLVLIEPANGTQTIKIAPGFDLAGATGDGKIAVCTVTSCPGGVYAKQSFEKLGIWAKVEPKLAQADNIRNALNLVARGEAKFGVVYLTDAVAEPNVKVIDTFPSSSHEPIVYPVALVQTAKGGSKNPDVHSFFAFLFSPEAGKILSDQGFTVVKE